MRNTYITLSNEDREYLLALTRKRTIQARIVLHAKILLYKADGLSYAAIAEKLDVNIDTVKLCVSKYNKNGIESALYAEKRSGRPPEISDDAKAWIVDVACQRPADLGYSQEMWTVASLHKHIQKNAETAGFPRLATVDKAYVFRLLQSKDVKTF